METAPIEPVPAPRVCDLSTTCLNCGNEMQPEHAHYRCPACGWRDSCCD
jgi:transposase